MHRVTRHSKSGIEWGPDSGKCQVNVSTSGWFCPTRKKLFAFHICEAVFRRGLQISSVCTHFSDYPNQYIKKFSSLSLPSLTQPCLVLGFYFLWGCCFWFLANRLRRDGQRNFFMATEKEKNHLVWYTLPIFLYSLQTGIISPHSQPFDMMA